jgi:hypothetical protein
LVTFSRLPYDRANSSYRVPAERRFARVLLDFCAPLFIPTLTPPVWIFSPGRAGGDCGRSDRRWCIVFLPAIPIVRSSADVSACYFFQIVAIAANWARRGEQALELSTISAAMMCRVLTAPHSSHSWVWSREPSQFVRLPNHLSSAQMLNISMQPRFPFPDSLCGALIILRSGSSVPLAAIFGEN